MSDFDRARGRRRAILHLNVADFASAVEKACDQSLRGKPLIVARTESARSLVYDMSEEAFREGVRKHMPLERARRICRGARVTAPRLHLYEKAMQALLERSRPFSPLVEAERDTGHLFLDLTGTTGLFGPPRDVARRLRKLTGAELNLEPIWSLAGNKLVAKAASRLVKPGGEIIIPGGQEESFMRSLPLHLVPGLEREDLAALGEYGLVSVEQALAWSPLHLGLLFGKRASFIHRALRGEDDAPVPPADRPRRKVSEDHEFHQDTNDPKRLEAALFMLSERAGARLRGLGLVSGTVALFLDYSDGKRVVRRRSRRPGTANDFILFDMARAAFESAWLRRVRVRHLRLSCGNLAFPPLQMELFAEQQPRTRPDDRLLAAMDRIRKRHGPDKLRLGRTIEGEGLPPHPLPPKTLDAS